MRFIVLFIAAVINIEKLKAESIDYLQKNNQIDMFPLHQEKEKDIALTVAHAEDYDEDDGNDIFFKHQLINYRKNIDFNDSEDYKNQEFDMQGNQFKSIDQMDDVELVQLSKYLTKVLQDPDFWEPPLIILKDSKDKLTAKNYPLGIDGLQNIVKKSRYYRRYPWKRQNSRSYNSMEYDPYNTCNPTRNDVFQLLVALHDARQGNKSRFVNFCNRRRPASAVFTNIRFLGRRRK